LGVRTKLKVHLWTLPRWAFLPFFGLSTLFGVVLAGGNFSALNTWLAFITATLIMCGSHSFNTLLDSVWTHLDEAGQEHSAEKMYTAGSVVISEGLASPKEVLGNALTWYTLSLIPGIMLAIRVTPLILVPLLLGMGVTFWYAKAKFNWTHELALGVGVGPLPVLLGMFSVSAHPPVVNGLLVSVPFAIVLSFLGLALDEAPDWEANVKKGVHSIAYEVSRLGISLEWYCSSWVFLLLIYQIFLIQINVLKPMTGLAFFPGFGMIPALVFLKANFRKVMLAVVALGALYCILLLIGQVVK